MVKKLLVVLLVSTIGFLVSCNINEPTAPRWDVSLNVPILKKNYTMYDIIEKKSPEISHYTTGDNKNVLYYTDVKKLDQIDVKNELTIDPFSENTSKDIGVISIASDSVNTDIGYDWVGTPQTPGSMSVIPPVSNVDVTTEFSSVDQFEYAKIASGDIDISFTNNLPEPINITINNLEIRNSQTGELIVQSTGPIVINSTETAAALALPIIQNVVVQSSLVLNCKISSNGSEGQEVLLPQNSLSVNAKLNNVEVSEASAKIPNQEPEVIKGSIAIDEGDANPTMFNNVKLANGLLNLTLTNNLDIDAVVVVAVPNLKNSFGATFTQTSTIPRKQTVNVLSNYSLKDYSLVSSNGSPTNQVSYTITYNPLASNDYRTVKSTDDVTGTVEFKSLQIKEFSGQLKPTVLEQTRSAVSLDVKDLQDKLAFQQINLYKPVVELRLKPTAQVEFSIEGRMEARNSDGQRSVMTLSDRTLNKTLITPTDTIVTLNPDSVSNFFKKFSKFPDSLIVYAGGVINPNYKSVVVSNSDMVTGTSRIEFPLDFGIKGGEISDSVEIDLSSDDRDQIKDLNYLEASLQITNGIPAEVSFIGRLYDESDNFLMYFPSQSNNADTIKVSGASIDSQGNVVSGTVQDVTIKMEQGDPAKLSQAKYMRVILKFSTSGNGNTPVRFKTDDTIDISASGSVNYRVNNGGN